MNCQEVEILLADYVDGTLAASDRAALEAHLAGCPACHQFAQDIGAATAFMERAAVVEPPAELVNKLIYEITAGPSRTMVKPPLGRRLFGRWFESVLQPRFAMSMVMTVLSLGMMLRFDGVRQLTPADLDPVKVWHATEDRVTRWWDRAMQYYQSLQVVFEIQTRYEEWVQQQGGTTPQTNPPGDAGGESK